MFDGGFIVVLPNIANKKKNCIMQLKFKTMQTMHLAEGDTAEKNQTFFKHQRLKKKL